ncbi:MAG: hypothetical protein HND58_03670 [Planctomycetota bacterium]|nr:MAG: hypothetical protein HND58_03670 [Planctomycetota bacterium]
MARARKAAQRALDWHRLGRLDFCEPDAGRFPAIGLAMDVIRRGGGAGAVLNAANEVAVEAFLAGDIPFGRIVEIVGETVARVSSDRGESLDDIAALDGAARECARGQL